MRYLYYHFKRKPFVRVFKLNLQPPGSSSSKSKRDENNNFTNCKKLEINSALKSKRSHRPNNRINKLLNSQTWEYVIEKKPSREGLEIESEKQKYEINAIYKTETNEIRNYYFENAYAGRTETRLA